MSRLSRFKHLELALFSMACAFVLVLFGVQQMQSKAQSESLPFDTAGFCIGVSRVANDIEITKVSIQRASLIAIGIGSIYAKSEDSSRQSCSIKLV